MVLLHILGGLVVLVGLALFVIDQIDGKEGGPGSSIAAWKINLSGPPALVLVLIGILVFVFPFSPFFNNPEDPNPPTPTTTISATPTTGVPASTTLTIVPDIGLPGAPISYEFVDNEDCGNIALVWQQNPEDVVSGWYLSIEAYNPDTDEVFTTYEIDTGLDQLTLGNVSGLCYQDFVSDEFILYYYIWIYAYNDQGYSESLFAEFYDF